jgi:GntR family transcriptional regulator
MPQVERSKPPYIQIQDHFRTLILTGELPEGARLPSIDEIAKEWGVAKATAAKSIAALGVEGYVTSSTQGTFASLRKGAEAGHDLAMRRAGRPFLSTQRTEVTEHGIILPPPYVAELLAIDLGPDARVARRQSVSYEGVQPRRLTVAWYPAAIFEAVPRLDSPDEGEALDWIREATGREPTDGRDDLEAREADVREARALGIKPGDTVLAGVHRWWDADGMIEYGEWVLPKGRVVSFPYAIG